MNKHSYTSVDYLLGKAGRGNKEVEPRFAERPSITESTLPKEHEQLKEPQTQPGPTPTIQIIPELPELDEELKAEGVELEDHDTIFVNSRKIDLPLPLERVDQGLHKPVTTGWRWLAELTKYILARFHIVIKKIGNKFRLVEHD